mmetsp:Transcript_71150/g.112699  ORF Transcript_71150/g.112699 Transcript_71150/m.112699 type:complete len:80 (+) Transcript_71150:348-587(+)
MTAMTGVQLQRVRASEGAICDHLHPVDFSPVARGKWRFHCSISFNPQKKVAAERSMFMPGHLKEHYEDPSWPVDFQRVS